MAPRPSALVLQCGRKGRDLSITASLSGKTKVCDVAGSVRRELTNSSIAGVRLNVAPFFQQGPNNVYATGHVKRELAVVTQTAKSAAELVMPVGMGMRVRMANLYI